MFEQRKTVTAGVTESKVLEVLKSLETYYYHGKSTLVDTTFNQYYHFLLYVSFDILVLYHNFERPIEIPQAEPRSNSQADLQVIYLLSTF